MRRRLADLAERVAACAGRLAFYGVALPSVLVLAALWRAEEDPDGTR